MNLQHLPPLLLVLALHAAALAYAMTPKAELQPLKIEPPTLSGVLLPPPVLTKPQTKPVEKTIEQPVKKTKVKPTPAQPPVPTGPASERAVQAPKPVAVAAKPKTATPVPPTKTKPALTPPPQIQLPSTAATGLHNQAPVYPKLSRKRKEQGTVLLWLLVSSQGVVTEIKIKQSCGFERLDQAAMQAVKKWQFSPAKKDGKAIDYWYEMPMTFSLNQPN